MRSKVGRRTALRVEQALAKEANLTLIGRAKGKKMIIANGKKRIIFDINIKNLNLYDTKSAQQKISE